MMILSKGCLIGGLLSMLVVMTGPVALSAEASPAVSKAGEVKPTDDRPAQCSDFKFDVSKELKLFAGQPHKITAATMLSSPPVLASEQLYEVALTEQAKVTFSEPPAKTTVNEGSYGGVLRIAAGRSTTLRVSLGDAAWIDVIEGTKNLDSARFSGSHNCALMRKSVEFAIQLGTPLILQLSGSTEPRLKVVVIN